MRLQNCKRADALYYDIQVIVMKNYDNYEMKIINYVKFVIMRYKILIEIKWNDNMTIKGFN